MSRFSTRFVATVAASTIAFSSAGIGIPAAMAQDPTGTTAPSGAPAAPGPGTADLVNAGANVTLNIQKYEGDPVGGTGAPADPNNLKPLSGVQFKIERIDGIDLTTADGWGELAGITPASLGDNSVGYTTTITTNTDGLASINTGADSEFKVGVYRVTEIQKGGYTVAPPFLITLPYSGANGQWVYERTVYPKNQNVTPNKQVDASNASLGSNMKYTINAPVPAGNLTRFNINDQLISNLALQTDPAPVVTADGVQLETTDYTVTTDNNTLRVEFNEAGLSKLQAARQTNPALQVHVAFEAKVVSLPANGVITNTATVELPNGAQITTDVVDDDPATPDTPTSTTFGNLTITKTAAAETNPNLEGAQFQVFRCEQQDGKWTVLGDALNVATTDNGSALSTTLTTGTTVSNQSTAQAFGLPISYTAGGATGTVTFQYCAVETKAPEGFVRDPEPRHIDVNADTRAMTVTVDNKKDSILGQLPATGAWGIVLIFLLGAALLGRGLYTSFRDNKDQQATA
ncbi:SpaH/EbpB family LPXTG-anchored major pilin [Corynebacterium auriscanis]|uniref:Uncharacterized protein n=1 Tax=Corynebacterium auriscanis TaxID=99807 RepID=A0A0A2DKC0_9CORY|nr:SpaH/EbpB family LPXTG-anchored major pilin [Corynebacterium auriscanis]KGM18222.1 hypothetical protein MA47_09060 [Corynebacterium auriscanis]WJY72240.1 Fimbrial subunit type 1 precursor [Corynebacterium auriscanis]